MTEQARVQAQFDALDNSRARAPYVIDRSPAAAAARAIYYRAAAAEAKTIAAILSPAYLKYVLGQGPRPHVP